MFNKHKILISITTSREGPRRGIYTQEMQGIRKRVVTETDLQEAMLRSNMVISQRLMKETVALYTVECSSVTKRMVSHLVIGMKGTHSLLSAKEA